MTLLLMNHAYHEQHFQYKIVYTELHFNNVDKFHWFYILYFSFTKEILWYAFLSNRQINSFLSLFEIGILLHSNSQLASSTTIKFSRTHMIFDSQFKFTKIYPKNCLKFIRYLSSRFYLQDVPELIIQRRHCTFLRKFTWKIRKNQGFCSSKIKVYFANKPHSAIFF